MEIDVRKIHEKIKIYWKELSIKIKTLLIKKEDLQQISKLELTTSVHKDIIKQIDDIDKEIIKIELFIKDKDFYMMDYIQLQKEYLDKPIIKKISFMDKHIEKPNQEFNKKYIDLLHKYNIDSFINDIKDTIIQMNIIKPTKKKCTNCNEKEFITNSEQNTEICKSCGIQTEKKDICLSYKELSRINTSVKYKYERHIHFKDAMNQFQGKQNVTILPIVYKDLEEQITINRINRKELTREQIILLLKVSGHSKHYEDVSLLYNKLTGKPIDDISHLEDKLLDDFEQVSETYDLLFKCNGTFERKSFINTHYILYQLLLKHKYPCSKNNFNILKTLDRKAFHDDIVQKICEHLCWSFYPLF